MEWKQQYYEELYHHGIKGQKWGVRRYQNPDGSLTPAGAKRSKLTNAVSQKINNEIEKKNQQFKDKVASRDPLSKVIREQRKERKKQQTERFEIQQAKGKAKVSKILAKISKTVFSPGGVDMPKGPTRQPWNEKRKP